jgi:hypothetical protein
MKKVLLILIALIGFGISANAQDVILKKDASEIKAKVLEITDQEIKYKEFDFQDGSIHSVNISKVFRITYENGRHEVFNNQTSTSTPKQTDNQLKMKEVYWRGGKLKYSSTRTKVENPESLFYGMNEVAKNYRLGTTLYGVGMGVWSAGFAITFYGIIDTWLRNKYYVYDSPIFWSGFGVAVAGGILSGIGNSKIKTAVGIYNASLRQQQTTALSLNLGITQSGGIGFILNY